jgi:hypothetical protein
MGDHGRQDAGHPLREDALEHARLQELVAAFADGELSREESFALEEHLLGCDRCRRELVLQRDLSHALGREPLPGASAGLRHRIEWMGEPRAERVERASAWSQRWASPALAALILIVAAAGAALFGHRDQASRPMAEIPLLRDALADCRRAMGRNFPKKADLPALTEGLRFPVHALDRPGLELFSTWKTTLAGSPAAGLAYRWRGKVVVQYTVPADVIRQQPELGETPLYAASQLGQAVIALLEGGSGTLLIADVPPEELRRLIL